MRRAIALAATALAAAVPVGAGAASIEKASPAPPKSGAQYSGVTEDDQPVTLVISGRSIQIAAFRFRCGNKAIASTSVQSIRLRYSDEGYRFKLATYGIVSYSDEQPDENGSIGFRGQFSRSAKTVSGRLRVKTPRCRDSGTVEWRAKRRSS